MPTRVTDPVVEVAWASDPFAVSPTWTDVSAYVREWSVTRERDDVLGRFQAGRADVVLENLDRRFEPFNTGSPYSPNVKRRKPVRILQGGYSLDLPGSAGHYALAPDSAAFDIAGDIVVWGSFAADDWTPTARQALVGRFDVAGTNRHHLLSLETTGRPRFFWCPNGTSTGQLDATATAAPAVSNGAWLYVLVWLDVDNGAGGNDTRFYTSSDGVTWTQLGTTVTKAGTTSLGASSMPLEIGARGLGTTEPFAGLVGKAEVRSGGSIASGALTGGTIVASPDFNRMPGVTSFADDAGNVWTIAGASSAFVRTTSRDVPIFRGFIDKIELAYPTPDAVAVLRCTDLLGLLATARLEVPYVREVLLDSPIAYWRFNEATGTQVNDSSGNRQIGTSFNVTLSQPDAITDDVDGAYGFNGTSSYVTSAQGAASPANPSAGFSAEIWFKTPASAAPSRRLIFAHDLDFTGQWLNLSINDLGAINFTMAFGTIQATGPYEDDAWHHCVVTYDGATTGRVYVDGSEAASSTSFPNTAMSTPGYLLVGTSVGGSSWFTGSLDEVAIYDYPLSSTRVAAHYAARNALLNETSGERVETIRAYLEIPEEMLGFAVGAEPGSSQLTGAGDWHDKPVIDALREVEVTEAGALLATRDGKLDFLGRDDLWTSTSAVTWTDGDWTAIMLSDPSDQVANVVSITRRNGTTQVVKDDASIDDHGETALSLNSIGNSESEALSRAAYELNRRADPDALRIEAVTFRPPSDTVLARELTDRVTVAWTPTGGGSAISQAALVTGVDHTYRARDRDWATSLRLSALEARAYWQIGTVGRSELGTTTRISF